MPIKVVAESRDGIFATCSPEKEGLRLLVEIRGVKQSHKFMDPATNMECERPLPPMPPAYS